MPATDETAKDRAIRIIRNQPADSSLDELIHELAMYRMIERGTADSDAGRVISHEEMKKEVEQWHKSGGPTKRNDG